MKWYLLFFLVLTACHKSDTITIDKTKPSTWRTANYLDRIETDEVVCFIAANGSLWCHWKGKKNGSANP